MINPNVDYSLNAFNSQLKENHHDVIYDIEKWELEHNKLFYLKNIPQDILQSEIFPYINCEIGIEGGEEFFVDTNEKNREFRSVCKEFAKAISISDCIVVLKITGKEDNRLSLKEEDVVEIENLRYLSSLTLEEVDFVSRAPRCKNLKVLTIWYSNLKYLPNDSTAKLFQLTCWGCDQLESLPSDLNTSLKILRLIGATKLSSLPDNLTSLTYLSIRRTNITSIPKTFVNLTDLYVSEKIKTIPKEITKLSSGNAKKLPQV